VLREVTRKRKNGKRETAVGTGRRSAGGRSGGARKKSKRTHRKTKNATLEEEQKTTAVTKTTMRRKGQRLGGAGGRGRSRGEIKKTGRDRRAKVTEVESGGMWGGCQGVTFE